MPNDAPEPTANKPALPTGLENTDYIINPMVNDYFTGIEGDTIRLDEVSLKADSGAITKNADERYYKPETSFAGGIAYSS